jgi:hypothetical protein
LADYCRTRNNRGSSCAKIKTVSDDEIAGGRKEGIEREKGEHETAGYSALCIAHDLHILYPDTALPSNKKKKLTCIPLSDQPTLSRTAFRM